MTRYSPSRHYLPAGWVALGLTIFSVWCATYWLPAAIAGGLFLASALALFFLASRPAIEIHEANLTVGRRAIPWSDIRRVDRTGWVSPLIVHLTLKDSARLTLVYPGDLDSANSLLRHLRRCAREALLDGIPHKQCWGEPSSSANRAELPSPRYPVLRPEDEADVEALYLRLKTVGRLDRKDGPDDK